MKSVLLTGSAKRKKDPMKRNTKIALVLCLAVLGGIMETRIPSVAAVHAQSRPVKMRFSGTAVATTMSLLPSTFTDEDHLEGKGTEGEFTFRQLRTDGPTTQPPIGCTSTRYFLVLTGAGVFRFKDGSLLIVRIAEGSGCIDLTAGNSQVTVLYEITGGTKRFSEASGDLTLKATFTPVFRNPSTNAPLLLTLTGEFEGTILGAAPEKERQDERQ